MAIGNHNDLTHIVRTSDQWKNTYDKYELIPTGVLCVELVSSDVTKIKIGDGHNIFSKLPYIGDLDLSKYYTKLETDTRIKEILTQEKVVRIKGIIGSKSDLPADARCGDIYFVRQLSSSDNKYIEYIYSPDNTWEPLGGIPVDIDLSEYAKTAYVDDKIEQVNERIDDIEQHGTHTHPNKEILDQITEPYTTADKETLASLHNYDDTEIREMISQSSHTHANKDILDATSAAFTREDKSKLDQLNPYDDSTIKERITELERVAHEHSNKRILDQTTASFTKEYERKMRWIRMYTGCTGMEEGIAGLVPAAQAGEEDYVLSGSGEWVPQTGGGGTYELPIATTSTLGGIKVGDGLEIDANGKLSVVGGGGSGDSIAEGDGITITTDPQTGVKTISVNTGDHLSVDSQTGELNVTDIDYEAGQGIRIGSNYNFLEYIKNSGNYDQIITTDITPLSTDKIELDLKFGLDTGLEDNLPLFGVRNTAVNPPESMSIFLKTSNPVPNLGFYNHFFWTESTGNVPFIENPTNIANTESNQRQILTITQNFGTWGTQSTRNYSSLIDQSYGELTTGISFFGYVYNTYVIPFKTKQMSMYGVKIYNSSNVLIHDLRPVERVSDNAAGLYDVLTNKFYGNAGGGSFVKGPVVTTPDRIINAKIGNGLQFDSNNAIEAPVMGASGVNHSSGLVPDPGANAGTSKYLNEDGTWKIPTADNYLAGKGIVITPNEWDKSNFDVGDFIDSIYDAYNGWVYKSTDSFTVESAPYFGAYTRAAGGSNDGSYQLTLEPNTTYRLSWDTTNPSISYATVYETSDTTSRVEHTIANTGDTFLEFTTTSDHRFIKTKFGISDSSSSATFSNIHMDKGAPVSANEKNISVNNGAGLIVNNDNELEVNIGNGLQINQDDEVEIDPSIIPDVPEYSAGEAITIRDVSSTLPVGYVEVDYIEGVGNYTVIDYIPNRKTKIVGTASQTQTSYDPVLFGNRTGSNGQQFVFWFNRYDSTRAKVGFVYGTNTWSTSSDCDAGKLIPYTLEDQFTFLISLDDEFNINDSFVHNITENGAPASNLKLGIFALVSNSSDEIESSDQIFRGRMYEFKIYEDDELVVNLIPAISTSTNQGGFYDVINDIFYTSKTATPFGYDPSTIHSTGKVIDVNYGNGLTVNQNNELEINTGDGLSVNADNKVEISKATSNTLGGIKVGSGFVYTSDGLLNATPAAPPFDAGDGLELIYDDIDALPNGYGHVDYVCSNPENNLINANGRARTLIDYIPTNTTKLAIKMQRDSERSDLCFIGSRIAPRDHEFCFWNEYDSVTELAFSYGDTNYSDALVTYSSYITGQIIEVECVIGDTSNTLSVNGTIVKTYTKAGDASPYKLGIFQAYLNESWSHQPANGKIYYIKLYEGDTLAVNLIPAVRLVDEAVGFYDNVNDKFYTSNTEYPFTTDMATLVIDGSNRTLKAKLGNGLRFDSNGAIEATGGGSGDTVAEGDGITITTDSQTGIKTIGINVGNGLDIDPLTNELFVNGQLPEGTIIKKLTYVGNGSGSSNVIKFTKKPVGILSINGSSGTNYISAIPASINSEYLHGVYGGVSSNGNSCSCKMSYNDATNELTFTQASGGNNDPGLIYNFNGKTYTMQYLVKGHAGSGTSENNEVSVVKTFSYVGTGTSTNNIQFPETPDMLLSIAGIGGDNTYVTTTPTPMDATKLDFAISDGSNNNGVGGALMSFNDTTNVLTLTSSRSDSWAFNTSGVTYQVHYIVNEVIASSIGGGTNYIPGEGIEFTELSSSLYADKVRMEITGIKSYSQSGSYAPYVQMRYLEFSDENHDEITLTSGTGIWDDGTPVEYPNPGESIDTMIAEMIANTGKMIATKFNGTKSLILTFDLSEPVSYDDLQYLRYKTGNDAPERDPISWKIYFNNTNSVNNWNLAAVVESATITGNRETWTQYFPLAVNEFNTVVISATGDSGDTVAEGNGISINTDQQTGEKVISVDIGSGLAFDPQTGAINVTTGSGDTVAEGAGIEITTDQQTGNKVIAINTGAGLQVNQTTNELEVSSGVVTSISPTQNTPGSITVTEGDGTTSSVSVISQMGGATSSTAGTAGYVPAPAAGDDDAYLRGDGTWDDSVVTEDDELSLVFVPDDYQPS